MVWLWQRDDGNGCGSGVVAAQKSTEDAKQAVLQKKLEKKQVAADKKRQKDEAAELNLQLGPRQHVARSKIAALSGQYRRARARALFVPKRPHLFAAPLKHAHTPSGRQRGLIRPVPDANRSGVLSVSSYDETHHDDGDEARQQPATFTAIDCQRTAHQQG